MPATTAKPSAACMRTWEAWEGAARAARAGRGACMCGDTEVTRDSIEGLGWHNVHVVAVGLESTG